jgi:hypothetical protein
MYVDMVAQVLFGSETFVALGTNKSFDVEVDAFNVAL